MDVFLPSKRRYVGSLAAETEKNDAVIVN